MPLLGLCVVGLAFPFSPVLSPDSCLTAGFCLFRLLGRLAIASSLPLSHLLGSKLLAPKWPLGALHAPPHIFRSRAYCLFPSSSSIVSAYYPTRSLLDLCGSVVVLFLRFFFWCGWQVAHFLVVAHFTVLRFDLLLSELLSFRHLFECSEFSHF